MADGRTGTPLASPRRYLLVQWPDQQPATIEIQGPATHELVAQAFALLCAGTRASLPKEGRAT